MAERNVIDTLFRRRHHHEGRYDNVDKEYADHGKKNPRRAFIDKLTPIIVLGGIALIYMLIINK